MKVLSLCPSFSHDNVSSCCSYPMDCHTFSKASMRIQCPHSEFNLNKTKNVTFSFKLALFLIFFLCIKIENLKKKSGILLLFLCGYSVISSSCFLIDVSQIHPASWAFLQARLSLVWASWVLQIPMVNNAYKFTLLKYCLSLGIFFILRSLQCLPVACKLPLSDLKSLP